MSNVRTTQRYQRLVFIPRGIKSCIKIKPPCTGASQVQRSQEANRQSMI